MPQVATGCVLRWAFALSSCAAAIALAVGCGDDASDARAAGSVKDESQTMHDAAAHVVDAGVGARCASLDPVNRYCMPQACAADELCFTNFAVDTGEQPSGDDRCHRKCEESGECEAGQRCVHEYFFGCSGDFNGVGGPGRGLCE